ncbi:YfaZ family protein [Klebsiella pneumoniae]|nr:YfaZ family protein [Klebsiella pneumoniae]
MMVARPAAWARLQPGSGPGGCQRRRAKAIHLGPKKGDNGVAFPVGGGVNVAPTDSIHVFGEGVCRAGWSGTTAWKNYVSERRRELVPIGPVTLCAGYRHVSVDCKEGRPNHTPGIDGAHVGGGSPSDYGQRPAIKQVR